MYLLKTSSINCNFLFFVQNSCHLEPILCTFLHICTYSIFYNCLLLAHLQITAANGKIIYTPLNLFNKNISQDKLYVLDVNVFYIKSKQISCCSFVLYLKEEMVCIAKKQCAPRI